MACTGRDAARALWQTPDPDTFKGNRDRALIGILLSCGLRRKEAADRTSPISSGRRVTGPSSIWPARAGTFERRPLRGQTRHRLPARLRRRQRGSRVSVRLPRRQDLGAGVTEWVVWHAVKDCAKKAGIDNLAPQDLRRTRTRPCRNAGGNWARSSSYWALSRPRRLRNILAVSNAFATRLTTGSAPSPTAELAPVTIGQLGLLASERYGQRPQGSALDARPCLPGPQQQQRGALRRM